jgi:hypothetical protein
VVAGGACAMGDLMPMKCIPRIEVNLCENDSCDSAVSGRIGPRPVVAWSR